MPYVKFVMKRLLGAPRYLAGIAVECLSVLILMAIGLLISALSLTLLGLKTW